MEEEDREKEGGGEGKRERSRGKKPQRIKKKRIRRIREEADRKRFTPGYCCEGAVAMSPRRRS